MAPLMFEKPADERFQNGYVRLISTDPAATVQDFKTNDANKISFTVTTAQPATIQYLFWPNKHLRAFVDGKKASFDRVDELSVVQVPAGTHTVKIIYKNTAMDIFLVLYFGFLGMCVLVIGFEAFKFLGRASLQRRSKALS